MGCPTDQLFISVNMMRHSMLYHHLQTTHCEPLPGSRLSLDLQRQLVDAHHIPNLTMWSENLRICALGSTPIPNESIPWHLFGGVFGCLVDVRH